MHSHFTVELRTALPLVQSSRQMFQTYYEIHYHENQGIWTELPNLFYERRSSQNESNLVRLNTC